jgi:hypothetical protein
LISDLSVLIKDLADHAHDHHCSVAVSGIGKSASDILKGHLSAHRQIEEIFLSPLSNDDIFQFLNCAADAVGFAFEEEVARQIAEDAMGFPYYAHLLGAACYVKGECAENEHVVITLAHYEAAKESVAKRVFRKSLQEHSAKINVLDADAILLLQYINLLKRRHLRLSEVASLIHVDNVMSEKQVRALFDRLLDDGAIIHRHRSLPDRVQFTEPLLRPFLRLVLGSPRNRKTVIEDDAHKQGVLFEL